MQGNFPASWQPRHWPETSAHGTLLQGSKQEDVTSYSESPMFFKLEGKGHSLCGHWSFSREKRPRQLLLHRCLVSSAVLGQLPMVLGESPPKRRHFLAQMSVWFWLPVWSPNSCNGTTGRVEQALLMGTPEEECKVMTCDSSAMKRSNFFPEANLH